MGVDADNGCRSIIIVDNDVVIVVIEIILIASAYPRVRDGIFLEVIVVAISNLSDALDAPGVVVVFSTLRIAQDDPADGIAVVGFYVEEGTLCQLIDGSAARSAGGLAIAELKLHLPVLQSESFYPLVLAYPLHGLA